MADSNNNGNRNSKTDSNLPILFANGYPTSLEKMTCEQIERFIPFLLDCSTKGEDSEATTPEWWPSAVPFKIPLEKPKNFEKVNLKNYESNFLLIHFFILFARTGWKLCGKLSKTATITTNNRFFWNIQANLVKTSQLISDTQRILIQQRHCSVENPRNFSWHSEMRTWWVLLL